MFKLNWRRWLISVPMALAVYGCASTKMQPYPGPTSSSIAFVNVQSLAGRIGSVATFERAEDCKRRLWFQSPFEASSDITQSFVRVDAGHSISISVTIITGVIGAGEYCIPIVNFTPEAGRYYRITLLSDGRACYGQVSSADRGDFTNAKGETFRKMNFSNGWDEFSSFCSPGDVVTPTSGQRPL